MNGYDFLETGVVVRQHNSFRCWSYAAVPLISPINHEVFLQTGVIYSATHNSWKPLNYSISSISFQKQSMMYNNTLTKHCSHTFLSTGISISPKYSTYIILWNSVTLIYEFNDSFDRPQSATLITQPLISYHTHQAWDKDIQSLEQVSG